MKHSEKYYQKIKESGMIGEYKLKRYGEYCRLEGEMKYAPSHSEVEEVLEQMAKEDNL